MKDFIMGGFTALLLASIPITILWGLVHLLYNYGSNAAIPIFIVVLFILGGIISTIPAGH